MIDTLALVPLEISTRSERRLSWDKLKKLLSRFSFSSDTDFGNSSYTAPSSSKRMRNFNFKNNKFLLLIPVVIVVLVGGFFLSKNIKGLVNRNSAVAGISDERVAVPGSKATQTLNKPFAFPLRDQAGKEVSKIKMILTTAEVRDEIVLKGQKASAVEGKEFLILNLKLTNDYSKTVQINTRDYVRLTANGSEEKLAADIHNDPVEVQAISTKYTRLGFPINDTDKNLTLYIGEINGPKETIKLTLP
jgi:hypothetical protein